MAKSPRGAKAKVGGTNLTGDLVLKKDPRFGIIWINPGRMSGTPCFFGTRVPVQTLWDFLEAGDTIVDFMRGFPGVTREQISEVLHLAGSRVVEPPRGRAA